MNHSSCRLISAPFYTIAQPFSITKSNYLTTTPWRNPHTKIDNRHSAIDNLFVRYTELVCDELVYPELIEGVEPVEGPQNTIRKGPTLIA